MENPELHVTNTGGVVAEESAINPTPYNEAGALESIALAQLSRNNITPISGSVLLSIIALIILSMLVTLGYGLYRTSSNINYIREIAIDSKTGLTKQGITPKLAIAIAGYSASYESAMFNRLFALLISYIIVFVGCVFVISNQIAYYNLKIEHMQNKSSLETSSPGLVLITLGCALVAVAILVPKGATLSVDDGDGIASNRAASSSQSDDHSGYNDIPPQKNSEKQL